MTPLSIAFLPLTDSAPLVVARAKGFAEGQGIDLSLVRTTSWATLRDRLVYGQVQAAHMLAPLAIAWSFLACLTVSCSFAALTLAGAGAALIWRRAGGEVRVGIDQSLVSGGARALGGVLLVGAGGIGGVVGSLLCSPSAAGGSSSGPTARRTSPG